MKYLKILPVLLFSLSMMQISFSQSVDDVINKHVEAVGGLDKINAVKSIRITGKFSSEGTDIPIVITRKGNDKIRMDLTISDRRLVMTYDGTEGWMTNPFGENPPPYTYVQKSKSGLPKICIATCPRGIHGRTH